MTETLFVVQAYRTKLDRLVALPAQVFGSESAARHAAGRLARFRAGIVVLSQTVDHRTAQRGRPVALAIHGMVPGDWQVRAAA